MIRYFAATTPAIPASSGSKAAPLRWQN